ncbi:MAG: hypothetical protein RI950_762 [Bacteroidota bacterium]
MRILGILFLGFIAFISLISADANYKENLSDYGFFKGTVKDQIPADGVMPYALNSPLFSDYASKLRNLWPIILIPFYNSRWERLS